MKASILFDEFTHHGNAIAEFESQLRRVLDRYYRVQGRSFSDTEAIEACKHQVLHLAKLVKKLALYTLEFTPANKEVVVNEVVPDLLIYAQELMFNFNFSSWPVIADRHFEIKTTVHNLLSRIEIYSSTSEAFLEVSKADAAIADICDNHDHRQISRFNIEGDVVVPFLRAAATLHAEFILDIDAIF